MSNRTKSNFHTNEEIKTPLPCYSDSDDQPTSLLQEEEEQNPFHIVYRYHGRKQHRVWDKPPFLILASNVDHWKVTGKDLAARGHVVFVWERQMNTAAATSPP